MHWAGSVFCTALFSALIAIATQQAQAISYTTIDHPLGAHGTVVRGTDGGTIVGTYTEASNVTHGFLYDGTTFTTIDSGFSTSSELNGIDGANLVGTGSLSAFLYDGATTTQLDFPGSIATQAFGVSDGNVVGLFQDPTFAAHGFLYDGASYTQLDDPAAIPSIFVGSGDTVATGIDGGTIVGYYQDELVTSHGFIFDGTSYTTLDNPAGITTILWGISGNLIVGQYMDIDHHFHGFVYDGANFTTIDVPGSNGFTAVLGVSGNTIVGAYGGLTDSTERRGFIATIPEPSTIILTALGGLAMLAYCRRRLAQSAIAVPARLKPAVSRSGDQC